MDELNSADWQKIIDSAPSKSAFDADGSSDAELPRVLDDWLRAFCHPFVAHIEHAQARQWEACAVVSIDISRMSRDPARPEGSAFDLWSNSASPMITSIIAPYCKPGAVLLVAGGDGISSLIRAATKSRFSHVGLIMPPLMTNAEPANIIPLWQSYARVPCRANYPPRRDFTPGQETAWGADVSDLARYMLHYIAHTPASVPSPRFVVRACHQPLTARETHDFYASVNRAIRDHVPYPHTARLALMFLRNKFPYLRALCDYLLGRGPIESGGEFCSMLAAQTLFDAGIAEPRGRTTDSFMPGDFSLDRGHESAQPAPAGDYDALYAPCETEFRFIL